MGRFSSMEEVNYEEFLTTNPQEDENEFDLVEYIRSIDDIEGVIFPPNEEKINDFVNNKSLKSAGVDTI